MPENFGAVARSMLNFNLKDVRLVSPKFKLDHEKIEPLAAGATQVIKNSKLFKTLEDAIKDLNFIFAFSARKRNIRKKILDTPGLIKEMKVLDKNNKIGIVFGPENSGLNNQHLSLVDRLVSINANDDFSSINLSHSVILFCYEWFKNFERNKSILKKKNNLIAKKSEFLVFINQLETKLEKKGFFKTLERKDIIKSKIRNIFNRNNLTKNEVDMLLGIINSLERKNFK